MDTRGEIEGRGKALAMNNSEGGDDEIAISIPTTTQAQDHQPPPKTRFDQCQITKVGGSSLKGRNEISVPMQGNVVATATTEAEDHHQPPTKGSDLCMSMHKAATEGDWPKAQDLLQKCRDLGIVELNEEGDRALHLAVQGNHAQFVEKLISIVGADVLMLCDGNGHTACHYAAMDDKTRGIARILMEINPYLINVENKYGMTPFALAISYGNRATTKCFLSFSKSVDIEEGEWFDILLLSITSKMFDVALEVVEMKPNLAIMRDEDSRTALHVISTGDDYVYVSHDFSRLAEVLWENMKSRHVLLLDAAKMGNLDIVDMITRDYPDLLSHMYEEKYSIFHIVVRHRSKETLQFLKKVRDVKKFSAVSRDKEEGNNFLHSAARSKDPEGNDLQILQDAYDWLWAVEAVAPPFYRIMRNIYGCTPLELFRKEREPLLRSREAHMKVTAESCMLISTIVITLVFAAAFAPPGGYNQNTGIPTLLKNKWFTSFIVFQVLALSSSTLSIIGFWSIISSTYDEFRFFILIPLYFRLSMCALLLSMLFIISAFLSAFFLVFVEERKGVVVSFMLPLYVVLVVGISFKLFRVFRKNYLQWYRDSNPYK